MKVSELYREGSKGATEGPWKVFDRYDPNFIGVKDTGESIARVEGSLVGKSTPNGKAICHWRNTSEAVAAVLEAVDIFCSEEWSTASQLAAIQNKCENALTTLKAVMLRSTGETGE